ncbi:MAG TPA: ergothioneine biosynthesis protein EgtC [Nocardia sp.]|uniref:ergothioneine biosynthesis protein EgtC n=1 Tax=Nocardia TaxID=1817 RepID=UPI002457B0B1|nr:MULTISPECIES: ergothioneine biosynthesis protein EgtC [Nocardia]HLS79665.1 ergothioneine biosynthesis protein EgtC [Nocardia sp.]
MCRHLGYVGPAVAVGELLTRGPHSLYRQSWAPREMRGGGTVNADGFGAAWWRPGRDGPTVSRYRNREPIWSDPAVTEVLGQIESTAVLGSVRSATVGMPVERTACAPFTTGRWAASHNGLVPNWQHTLTAVAARLDVEATRAGQTRLFQSAHLLAAEAPTDAAALWVLLAALIGSAESGGYGANPPQALRLFTRTVLDHAPEARLNLLLCDGATLLATTVYHALSALVTDEFAVLSSEPYDDDPRWRPIPDRCLVVAAPGVLTVEPLDPGASVPPPHDSGAQVEGLETGRAGSRPAATPAAPTHTERPNA